METIHVFFRQHAGINDGLANLFGERRLHQNAVQMAGGIQAGQQGEQIGLAGGFRQHMRFGNDAQFGAGLFLATDINLGGGVFPHPHKGQPGNDPLRFQLRNPGSQLALNLRRDGAAINEIVESHYSTTWMR